MSYNASQGFDFDAIEDDFTMKGFDFELSADLLLEDDIGHLIVPPHDNMELTSSPDCLTDFLPNQNFLDFDIKPFDGPSDVPFSSFTEPHPFPDDDVVSSSDDFADSFSTPSSAFHHSSNSSDDNRSAVWSLDHEDCLTSAYPRGHSNNNAVKRIPIAGAISSDNKSTVSNITISLLNSHGGAMRNRQQSGVMSGRIKKKDPFLPTLRVKSSPNSSPTYYEEETVASSSSTSSNGSLSKMTVHSRMPSSGTRIRNMPQPPARVGHFTASTQHATNTIPTIHLRPNALPRQDSSTALMNTSSQPSYFNHATLHSVDNSYSSTSQLQPRGYSLMSANSNGTSFSATNFMEGSNSSIAQSTLLSSKVRPPTAIKLEYGNHSHDYYSDSTTNSSASNLNSSRTPIGQATSSTSSLLHSSLSTQSDLWPITDEERKEMDREGIPIPLSFPLTKIEEKNLKRVRRRLKNKRSAMESRRKKKEYMERLEKHADAISQENNALRRRLEDMEHRLERSEALSRQLMSRLCKVSAAANNVDTVNGSDSCSPVPNHNQNSTQSSRLYSPPPCSTSSSSGNSTKFYIMAFVLLFSVLFAGDPTLIMLRSTTGIDSFMLASGGSRGAGALFYYSHRRWPHRADMFCPAGVRDCHKMMQRQYGSASIHHVNDPLLLYMNHGVLHSEVVHSKMAGRDLRPHVPDVQIASLPDFIRTPSVLLDVQNEPVEESDMDCSLTRFWKSIWSEVPSYKSEAEVLNEDHVDIHKSGMMNVTRTGFSTSAQSRTTKISVALPQAFTLMQ